jgi:hypothetical protein
VIWSYAFCIQGDEYPGLGPARRQCLASASGRNLAYMANSYFGGESDDPYALSKLSASLSAVVHSRPAQSYWVR